MTLDEIRQDILRRLADASIEMNSGRARVSRMEAELEAHDRAVAVMPAVMNGEIAMPKRAPRRDIPALVREALTDKPQGLKQLAKKTGVAPVRLRHALSTMRLDGEAIAASGDNKTFWCPP